MSEDILPSHHDLVVPDAPTHTHLLHSPSTIDFNPLAPIQIKVDQTYKAPTNSNGSEKKRSWKNENGKPTTPRKRRKTQPDSTTVTTAGHPNKCDLCDAQIRINRLGGCSIQKLGIKILGSQLLANYKLG